MADDSLVILDPGAQGDPETGDGWRPRIALEHDAERHELYVIVGEETGSMTEGVSTESFEEIRRRLHLLNSASRLHAAAVRARRLLYMDRPQPLTAAMTLSDGLAADPPGGIAGGVLDGTYDPGGQPS